MRGEEKVVSSFSSFWERQGVFQSELKLASTLGGGAVTFEFAAEGGRG